MSDVNPPKKKRSKLALFVDVAAGISVINPVVWAWWFFVAGLNDPQELIKYKFDVRIVFVEFLLCVFGVIWLVNCAIRGNTRLLTHWRLLWVWTVMFVSPITLLIICVSTNHQ